MGRPLIDLTGRRFGKLVAQYHAASRLVNKQPMWFCECDCGKTKLVDGSSLRSGQSQSCGCERIARAKAAAAKRKFSPNKLIDLTGMKFWRWTVVAPARKDGEVIWWCQCECGTEKFVSGPNLRSGKTKSCGCLQKEMARNQHRVHRMSGHPIYNSWGGMRDRCYNPNTKEWQHYGGRGIKVCKRWDEFKNFLADMFATWEPGLTLDRIDVNGNYEPSNCRWADYSTQNRNRRSRAEIKRSLKMEVSK